MTHLCHLIFAMCQSPDSTEKNTERHGDFREVLAGLTGVDATITDTV